MAPLDSLFLFVLFPLIKLAKKLKDSLNGIRGSTNTFPLIKLAKKLKAQSTRRSTKLL